MTEPIQPEPGRPASSPLVGGVRGALSSGVVATTVVLALGVANPAAAAIYIALGTGIFTGAGKTARDYIARPAERQGTLGTLLAHAFAWLF